MTTAHAPGRTASSVARARFRRLEGRPLFLSDWVDALFIHFSVDPKILQPEIPFTLDLFDDKAIVSLVAFTMRGLRPSRGGSVSAFLTRPVATHGLLNVRTYMKHRGESGIYFIAEWIPNRLSRLFGPRTYGLPYRLGCLEYRHRPEEGLVAGRVDPYRDSGALAYEARCPTSPKYEPACPGSRSHFLCERYTAFTRAGRRHRLFRIWHEPWMLTPLNVTLLDASALSSAGCWFKHATLLGAEFSPGVRDVWIGRPRSADAAAAE